MVLLAALWMPILLSAVVVFIASSILHMVLPYHQGDYKQLPDEEKLLAGLRAANLQKGLYMFPFGSHKEMNTPAMKEKFTRGPVGTMMLYQSGPPVMGKFLGLWFVFCLLVSFLDAYLTGHTVAAGARYLTVFRVAGAAGFMGYGLGPLVNSIWKGQPWGMTIKEVVDGLIYALLTAGVFGWLWPR